MGAMRAKRMASTIEAVRLACLRMRVSAAGRDAHDSLRSQHEVVSHACDSNLSLLSECDGSAVVA
jgi:hypothetical protein